MQNHASSIGKEEQYRLIRRVTLVGAAVDLILGVAKILFGTIGHSQGLVADGVHSLSDIATDIIVIWAARHSTREADADHPYGHERIQTVSTMLLGLVLIIVGVGIAYDAVVRVFQPDTFIMPSSITLLIAFLSIALKEGIYHYTVRTAKKIKSNMLHANAWHSRLDALSSVVVLVGIGGTMLGLVYLDAIAAIIVAIMIGHVAWKLVRDSLYELIDTGLEDSHINNIRETIGEVQGVRSIHQLRTRRMGSQILADIHVIVDPRISVSEGHRIGDEVEKVLMDEVENATDITIHIDPEDDSEFAAVSTLPLRAELLPLVKQKWAEISEIPVENVVLHYLQRKVHLELKLPLSSFQSETETIHLAARLKQTLSDVDDIGDISISYDISDSDQ